MARSLKTGESVKTIRESTGVPTKKTHERSSYDVITDSAFTLFPGKSDWILKWCQTLIDWSELDDSLTLQGFCRMAKLSRDTLYVWADKYPEFKRAFDFARLTLAQRREEGALKREYSEGIYKFTAHWYDDKIKEVNKYHADLKKDEERDANKQFVVLMQRPEVKTQEELKKEIMAID